MKREYLKNIKSENRIDRIRLIMPNDPVIGGQPSDNADDFTSNTPLLDIASTMKFAIDSINKTESNANNRLEKNKNLSDLQNKTTARSNLGLKSSATLDATSTLSDRTDQVATPKMVNDVNRAASTAQKTANNAHALAQTKQDKLTFVGDGPAVMKTGAFGLGARSPVLNITDFNDVPLVNATYTIAGEAINGPRGSGTYTGTLDVIVRLYSAGPVIATVFRETDKVWERVKFGEDWRDWKEYLTTSNTTLDKSGFLRASGSANALVESDRTSSYGSSKALVATQYLVNETTQKATNAHYRADEAYSLAQTKQDKLTFVGDGPAVMKTGAFGLGARSPVLNITDFNDVPLVNATYTISGEAINGPRGSGTYTGTLDVIVRLYNSGSVIATVFRETDKVWERVKFGEDWRDWKEYLTTSNTTLDKSGFLRASGSANALVESDVTNSLGNSKSLVASQALVSSLNSKIKQNSISKGINGWWRCGETNLIVQWGRSIADDIELTINFPITFTSRCTSVQATSWVSLGGSSRFPILTANPQNSSFSVRMDGGQQTTFYWVAYGY